LSDEPFAENLYLTIHNIHKRQTSMLLAGLKPAISASERPTDPHITLCGHWDWPF